MSHTRYTSGDVEIMVYFYPYLTIKSRQTGSKDNE